MTDIELKPCPFCARKSVITGHNHGYEDSSIWCTNCGATGPNDVTMPRAIKMWNLRRTEDTLRAEIARLTAELERAGTCTWTYCTDEMWRVWDTECGQESFIFDDGTPEKNNMNFCSYCGKKLVQVIPEPESEDEE